MTSRSQRWSQAWHLILIVVMAAQVAAAADDPAGTEFFEKKIRPLLVDNCYSCHSQQSKKAKGSLLLDTRAGLLTGGDTGPAIKPGDPDQSLLIKAVRYVDADLQMPPKNKKLSPEAIALLEAWVKMGAPDPRVAITGGLKVETIREKAKTHWAFQPVKEPAIPVVREKHFVKTPMDNFILARLEAAHLKPSPAANRRTLIRRATFDLIGLPPTPEEVATFEADKSPDAYAKVVDRLLASPHYGERWGRHWLDVARYADTKGYVFEEDRHYPYSYTYRDYVIRAFNEDLPYDQFIREQIAADLLPAAGTNKSSLAALGYLTLGRRFVNNINDIIDDRIDVVCRGMMGLTVTCARCHDHKYDPIPTKDYYSLYGVFASSMEPQVEPLLGTTMNGPVYEKYLAEHKKREDTLNNYRVEKENAMGEELRVHSGNYMLAAFEAEKLADKSQEDSIAVKYKLHPEIFHRWIASLKEWQKKPDAIFTPWFAFAALPEKDFAVKAKEVAASFATKNKAINPLVAKAFDGAPPANMKDVADRYGKLLNDVDEQWHKALAATNAPTPKALPDAAPEALRQVLYADNAPANYPVSEFVPLYDVPTSQELRRLKREIDALDATDPGAPPRATALLDDASPHDVHVFLRGNSGNQGPEAPREFLEILSGPNRKPFTKGSGRLELAEDIASKDNPLTARVFVNRVWLHHFGSPLVSTPSDFGLRSDPPTNPELLDYLAARFMADGWSVKKLQRLIMLSATYRQSSEDNTQYAKIDPGNDLYWRMNRQRLEFEPMRDTLLAVSGRLDLTAGGQAVDITTANSDRRTVYGFVDRQNLPDLFRAFDFASPDTTSPRRFYTTVPQQALFLMNNPFVIEQAKSLVNRPGFKNAPTEQQRLRWLYQRAFQRDPSREEIKLAHDFTQMQMTEPSPANVISWQFGYGSFDTNAQRVAFHKLTFFDGRAFQGGPTLPDPALGWVVVSGTGGHPGNDQQHASIRRWIAPRDGNISIKGELAHGSGQGDGVRGRVVSSKLGLLGQWLVQNRKQEINLDRVAVKRGDQIDFVTDCNGNQNFDSFTWSPVIRFVADGKTVPGQRMKWNAQEDFQEAATGGEDKNLSAWERYAQVLLLTNELVFVD